MSVEASPENAPQPRHPFCPFCGSVVRGDAQFAEYGDGGLLAYWLFCETCSGDFLIPDYDWEHYQEHGKPIS